MKRKIGFEIGHCSRIIRRYIDTGIMINPDDEMTGTHGRAIGYFYKNRHRDIFQKDFEKEFDIRRSTASNILALMEKNGLITREGVPQDARLKKILLTEKAVDLHREIESFFQKMEKDISYGIEKEELEAFFTTMDKIKNNIERMTAENDQTTE